MHYYARERYFRKVAHCVLEVVKECGSDPLLTFWKGYSTVMEGKYVYIEKVNKKIMLTIVSLSTLQCTRLLMCITLEKKRIKAHFLHL